MLHRIPRFKLFDAQLTVTIVAVGLAALALFVALRNDRRVILQADEDVSVVEAEAILARATEATAFADSILSFLEGAAVVVGAGLTIGAWMLRNSIQNQIEANRDFVEQAEQRFEERQRRLDEMEASLQKRHQELVDRTSQEIANVHRQARDSFRVLSLLVLAEQQVRAHNLDTALRTLEAAYQLDPENQATNYLLGYLFITRKQFDAAIERLECALKMESDFAPAIAALGLALRRKGDSLNGEDRFTEQDRLWAQAETRLLEALELDARLTDADGQSYYGTLGGLYRRQRRYDAAIRAYEQAQAITPNSSYPVSNLATLYKHQGRDAESARYFEMVLKIAEQQLDDDPRDYWARADYAQAKLVLGDPDSAANEMRAVLEQVQERGVLETIRSGLQFLAESPHPPEGLDTLIGMLDQASNEMET